MRIAPIVEQVAGDEHPFVKVGGAIEFARLDGRPGRLPQAFVVPMRDTARANSLGTQAIDQLVEDEFAVFLLLEGGGRNEAAIDEQLDELSEFVIGRLLGWMMPGASTPVTYAGGSLTGVSASLITWSLRFRTAHHLRKTS